MFRDKLTIFVPAATFDVCWYLLQTVWTQIKTDRISVLSRSWSNLIRLAVWHFGSIPDFFLKNIDLKEVSRRQPKLKITRHAKSWTAKKRMLMCWKKILHFNPKNGSNYVILPFNLNLTPCQLVCIGSAAESICTTGKIVYLFHMAYQL